MYKSFCVFLTFIVTCLSAVGINVRHTEKCSNTVAASVKKVDVMESESVELSFDRQPVNTVEIKLKDTAKELIEIYNGDELIYTRNGIEKERFCAFKTVEAENLTVKISGDEVRIKSIKASHKISDKDFRVTSYFIGDRIIDASNLNPDCFDVITDAILFSCVRFDSTGKLLVETETLEKALSNLRKAIGEREVNIYINLLGPDITEQYADWNEGMSEKAALHTAAFKSETMVEDIVSLVDKYSFDGVFFDYEYPIKKKNWRPFSKFLVSLNKATDKKIGIALAGWDIGLSFKAARAVDMYEMMQYDLFNAQGNHSDMDTADGGIVAARNYMISDEKIDLGIPFYARPEDQGAVWLDYASYADKLGKSNDVYTDENGLKHFFNSWQTVYDKTAYAISRGIGGVMVWHYNCDLYDVHSELSLFGAMGQCMSDRMTG